MRCTQILYPLDDEVSLAVAKPSKELWKSIKNKLNDLNEGKDITFDELLQELECFRTSIYPCNTVSFKHSNHLLEKKSK